jgi:hypothetical protein
MKTINLTQQIYNEKDEPVLSLPGALIYAMIETPHHDPGPIMADEKLRRDTPLFFGQLVEMLTR